MDKKKILVVDDEANIRELLIVNLAAAGYEVETALNGRDAIGKIVSFRPALIVLDVMMPEIDGWEVCKLVRDDESLEHLRIVMLTAKATDRDRMIGRGIFGADEYITKPFDMDELLSTIKRLLAENEN